MFIRMFNLSHIVSRPVSTEHFTLILRFLLGFDKFISTPWSRNRDVAVWCLDVKIINCMIPARRGESL